MRCVSSVCFWPIAESRYRVRRIGAFGVGEPFPGVPHERDLEGMKIPIDDRRLTAFVNVDSGWEGASDETGLKHGFSRESDAIQNDTGKANANTAAVYRWPPRMLEFCGALDADQRATRDIHYRFVCVRAGRG